MYDPLDRSASQIRLLRLLPGHESDEIVCELCTISLDHSNVYEALSYVWGTRMSPSPIILGGTPMPVKENLDSALHHLRDEVKDRILWVDALCINQKDVDERNWQVRLMHRVYSDASQVVVWLGTDHCDKDDAFEMIEKIGSDPELHWTDFETNRPGALLRLWAVIRNEWWTRVWTVQEAVLAKRITYQRARACLSGQTLTNLAESYVEHIHNRACCSILKSPQQDAPRVEITGNLKSIMDNIVQLRQIQQLSHKSFDEVASLYRDRRATNPRDMVYGLLGISCGITQSSIGYELTKIQVYESATRDCISYNNNLNILSHVIHHRTTDRGDISHWEVHWREDEPSWVLDWTIGDVRHGSDVELIRYRAAFLQHYSACGTLEIQHSPSSSAGKFQSRGISCDVIESVSNSVLKNIRFDKTDHIKDWRRMAGIEKDPGQAYIGGDTISEAFWRILCLDIYASDAPGDGATLIRRAAAKDQALHLAYWYTRLTGLEHVSFERGDADFAKRFSAFNEHIGKAFARRKFFVSQKGYMGFAPIGTKPADRICVLAGGRAPLIVRAVPENGGEASKRFVCRLLGDAYVHGLMDGEAMKLVDDGVLKVDDFELI